MCLSSRQAKHDDERLRAYIKYRYAVFGVNSYHYQRVIIHRDDYRGFISHTIQCNGASHYFSTDDFHSHTPVLHQLKTDGDITSKWAQSHNMSFSKIRYKALAGELAPGLRMMMRTRQKNQRASKIDDTGISGERARELSSIYGLMLKNTQWFDRAIVSPHAAKRQEK